MTVLTTIPNNAAGIDVRDSINDLLSRNDSRVAIPLLFHASKTGTVKTAVPAGLYQFKIDIGTSGSWNGSIARLVITSANGDVIRYGPFRNNSNLSIELFSVSSAQVEIVGSAYGLYAALVPPKSLSGGLPSIYWRPASDSGLTARTVEATSGKLDYNGYKFFEGSVGQPYSIMRAFSEKDGWLNHYRFECVPYDYPAEYGYNDRTEYKSEYNRATNYFDNCIPYNTDTWVAFDLLIEPGPVKIGEWAVIGQFHATEDPADQFLSPPFAVQLLKDDVFTISTRTSPNAAQANGNYTPTTHYSVPNFARGVFHKFVMRFRFGWNNDALLQVWKDGVLIVDQTSNFNMGYNDQYGPHWAFGLYQAGRGTPTFPYSPETNRHAIQFANMDIKTGTDALRSRITNTLPIVLTAERQF